MELFRCAKAFDSSGKCPTSHSQLKAISSGVRSGDFKRNDCLRSRWSFLPSRIFVDQARARKMSDKYRNRRVGRIFWQNGVNMRKDVYTRIERLGCSHLISEERG